MINMINTSVILTGSATLAGLYLLYLQLSIFKRDFAAHLSHVLPVIIGTISWLTACYEFAVLDGTEFSIEAQRAFMLVSWVWLASIVVYNGKRGK